MRQKIGMVAFERTHSTERSDPIGSDHFCVRFGCVSPFLCACLTKQKQDQRFTCDDKWFSCCLGTTTKKCPSFVQLLHNHHDNSNVFVDTQMHRLIFVFPVRGIGGAFSHF